MTTRTKTPKKAARGAAAKTTGQRLAQIRMERGFTQSGLSNVTGIAQNIISGYESEKIRLHADVLVRLSKMLDVSVDELLGIKKRIGRPTEPPGMKILRRMEKLQALPDSIQNHILKTLDILIVGAKKRTRK